MAKVNRSSRSKVVKSAPSKVKKVAKSSKVQKVAAKKAVKSNGTKKTSRGAKVVRNGSSKKITPKRAPKKNAPKKSASPKSPTALVASKAPRKALQASGPKGYTPAEYQRFLSEKKRLEGCSNQELKDILRKNQQSMSGNKDDLVYKVADGIVLGRIPRCPKCFGGRPKFDFKKGTYYCSGYRDDEDFKNCHTSFTLAEITRDKWE